MSVLSMTGCQLSAASCKPQLLSINVRMSWMEGEEALSAEEAAAQQCLAQMDR